MAGGSKLHRMAQERLRKLNAENRERQAVVTEESGSSIETTATKPKSESGLNEPKPKPKNNFAPEREKRRKQRLEQEANEQANLAAAKREAVRRESVRRESIRSTTQPSRPSSIATAPSTNVALQPPPIRKRRETLNAGEIKRYKDQATAREAERERLRKKASALEQEKERVRQEALDSYKQLALAREHEMQRRKDKARRLKRTESIESRLELEAAFAKATASRGGVFGVQEAERFVEEHSRYTLKPSLRKLGLRVVSWVTLEEHLASPKDSDIEKGSAGPGGVATVSRRSLERRVRDVLALCEASFCELERHSGFPGKVRPSDLTLATERQLKSETGSGRLIMGSKVTILILAKLGSKDILLASLSVFHGAVTLLQRTKASQLALVAATDSDKSDSGEDDDRIVFSGRCWMLCERMREDWLAADQEWERSREVCAEVEVTQVNEPFRLYVRVHLMRSGLQCTRRLGVAELAALTAQFAKHAEKQRVALSRSGHHVLAQGKRCRSLGPDAWTREELEAAIRAESSMRNWVEAGQMPRRNDLVRWVLLHCTVRISGDELDPEDGHVHLVLPGDEALLEDEAWGVAAGNETRKSKTTRNDADADADADAKPKASESRLSDVALDRLNRVDPDERSKLVSKARRKLDTLDAGVPEVLHWLEAESAKKLGKTYMQKILDPELPFIRNGPSE
ncbi:Reticulocyte-binding protein 2-like a [Hondaea fermentalgiana]|uniref:Reticulocyte-binding protein 2-like a n=1 Tax=Hondaea fermentalgiana TaxID=2315210 RepID=A0A2R5GDJ8_9STRA|nr:Reticulocyte-binding protein 2-like a [Hondaea fermentalgiana]|eukprot:GBG29027.1 Reticulocyte-binding protein 2-like a [Hondaea fermentalgiana]